MASGLRAGEVGRADRAGGAQRADHRVAHRDSDRPDAGRPRRGGVVDEREPHRAGRFRPAATAMPSTPVGRATPTTCTSTSPTPATASSPSEAAPGPSAIPPHNDRTFNQRDHPRRIGRGLTNTQALRFAARISRGLGRAACVVSNAWCSRLREQFECRGTISSDGWRSGKTLSGTSDTTAK